MKKNSMETPQSPEQATQVPPTPAERTLEQAEIWARRRERNARESAAWEKQHPLDQELLLRASGDDPDALRLALNRGANPEALDEDGNTALLIACQMKAQANALILAKVSDGTKVNRKGATPLMLACAADMLLVVKALLPRSDPLAMDNEGRTALMRLCSAPLWPVAGADARRVGCLRAVLPVSDAFAFDDSGNTALMQATQARLAALIPDLVIASDPNARSLASGLTALEMAAKAGSEKLVELLLPHTEWPKARKGRASLPALAKASGNKELTELLEGMELAQAQRKALASSTSAKRAAAPSKPRL